MQAREAASSPVELTDQRGRGGPQIVILRQLFELALHDSQRGLGFVGRVFGESFRRW